VRKELTVERLRELLHYAPETGVFTWRQDRRCGRSASVLVVKAGDVAGCIAPDRRVLISVDSKRYKAHRLAWFYVTGAWPNNDIDHRDGDSTNNRWSNLRDVPHGVNMENIRKARPGSSSGLLGVSWHPASKSWHARISIGNRGKSLGYYKTPEEGHKAYLEAKRRLHEGCTI
jgi:hypothetical protein